MIISFRHRALRRYWETGLRRGLNANWMPRIHRILSALDTAAKPEDMNIPGYRFHALAGDQAGRYSVSVTANWRVTFEFVDGDVAAVDLEDYH